MKKILEDYLWERIPSVSELKQKSTYETINQTVALGMINSPKQAWRTLEKWTDKRIYEYGSRLDLGWKVTKGKS